jgi:hypothetical protein
MTMKMTEDEMREFWVGVRWVVYAALVVLALGIVGRMDFEDAKMMDRRYCEGVEQGLWPDYNRNYHEVCK